MKEVNSPQEIENPRAVYFSGKICLCEGWRVYHNSLYILEAATRQWSTLSFYDNQKKCGLTLAVTKLKLYAIGGHWKKEEYEEMYSGKVDTLTKDIVWSQESLPPLITGRRAATSVGFDNYVLVAGGWGNDDELLSSVEGIYTALPAPYWWEVCSLPVKTHYLQSTVANDSVYFGLGFHSAKSLYFAQLSDLEMLINSKQILRDSDEIWKVLPDTPYKLSGLGNIGNTLLVVGGRDDKQRRSSAYVYNWHKGKWTEVFQAEPARESSAVVTSSSDDSWQVIVLCGWGGNRTVQSLTVNVHK